MKGERGMDREREGMDGGGAFLVEGGLGMRI